jgi:hypothetical protein
MRYVRHFIHRTRAQLFDQREAITKLCEAANVRACTRLAPRSFAAVGRVFTAEVVSEALVQNWICMDRLWLHAAGVAKPKQKLWLFDCDDPNDPDLWKPMVEVTKREVFVTKIPSKKGFHWVVKPHHLTYGLPKSVTLHKDNPTNLYIPERAN